MSGDPCRVRVRILYELDFIDNVHLFRVPRGWTGSVQLKSSMPFIRSNRCIYTEKDYFINGETFKRVRTTFNDNIHD